MQIAKAAELFRTEWGDAYADIWIDGHRETWPLDSDEFKQWLTAQFFNIQKRPLRAAPITTVLGTLQANAWHGKIVRPVFLRVAQYGDNRYLDLANKEWEAVEISAKGWRVIPQPEHIRFRRVETMSALPKPLGGGKIGRLKPFLGNIEEDGFVLVVAWLLSVLNGKSPYPVLIYSGTQGSAKSSATRFTRRIIDPASPLLGTLPTDAREYSRAIGENLVLACDNISELSGKASDALCRLTTGGLTPSFQRGARPCANHERPIILNGIVDFVQRPDLADRALFVTLDSIAAKSRKTEAALAAQFVKIWPKILGALLVGVAAGLANADKAGGQFAGRMLDLGKFVEAAEPALWGGKKLAKAFARSLEEATGVLTESDPLAVVVIQYIEEHDGFTGTATNLLGVLTAKSRRKLF